MMTSARFTPALLALLALKPDMAFAQQLLPSSPPGQARDSSASPPCELHVITAPGLSVADSTDFKDSGLIGGLMSGLYKKPDYDAVKEMANAEIGPEGQERLINANLDKLPARFAGYRVIFERGGPQSIPAFKDAKRSPRLAASNAPCLAEISVIAIAYIRTSLSRGISSLFMFRQFGPEPQAKMVVSYANSAPARAFPPKSQDDVSTAQAELAAAFTKVYAAFLQKIAKAG